jgi:predicted phosphodiesterase
MFAALFAAACYNIFLTENIMRIAIASDVHLEFGAWSPINPEGADVLILSGDILVSKEVGVAMADPHKIIPGKGHSFIDFMVECKQNYKEVIYIMGNHEHYHGDFAQSPTILSKVCSDTGIHFLEKSHVKIGDVTFIGGTLWTDMNKEDPITIQQIKGYMNDYRIIEDSSEVVHYKSFEVDEHGRQIPTFRTRPAKFSPEKSVVEHKAMLEYIRKTIVENPSETYVVVGHHSPSKLSTKPQYEKDVIVNGAYSSDLSEFILDHPQIKVWTHGHTHHEFDYMIGSTRIVCNPRGYVGYERGSDKDEPYFAKVVEV